MKKKKKSEFNLVKRCLKTVLHSISAEELERERNNFLFINVSGKVHDLE